jgi:site-specific DNA-methyltransferase (adenine-specific)
MTKKSINAIMSSKSVHWATPIQLLKRIDYDLDPCPLNSQFDGLKISWKNKNVFCNPPYSDISIWVDKVIHESKKVKDVKFLVPARTDTRWFHKLVESGVVYKIIFFKGRLKFNESGSAPFPSVMISR